MKGLINQVPLDDLVEKAKTWNPQQEAPNLRIQYVDISSVDKDTKQISDVVEVLGADAPSRARQLIRAGDVLVSTVRPNLNGVACVPLKFDGSTASTGYCVLRPRKRKLDSRYLYHWVRTPHFIRAMTSQATGASYPAVTDKIVKASLIPLPPFSEQCRIASILDKADALRQQRRAALAKLDVFIQSAFLDTFGDLVTNSKAWETISLGKLILDGPQNGLYRHSSDYGSGVPIIRIDSFPDGGVVGLNGLKRVNIDSESITKYGVKENDILINRVNAPSHLGKAAIVPSLVEPTVFESNMMRFSVDTGRILPQFLLAQMQHEYIKRQIAKSRKDAVNQSSINQGDVKAMEIRVPPLQIQEDYINVLERVKKIVALNKNCFKAADHLLHSLQQRAFRGEL